MVSSQEKRWSKGKVAWKI